MSMLRLCATEMFKRLYPVQKKHIAKLLNSKILSCNHCNLNGYAATIATQIRYAATIGTENDYVAALRDQSNSRDFARDKTLLL